MLDCARRERTCVQVFVVRIRGGLADIAGLPMAAKNESDSTTSEKAFSE